MIVSNKEHIIKMVQVALNECYTAPEDPDKGYAYATGFAKSTLHEVLEYLSKEQVCQSEQSLQMLTQTNMKNYRVRVETNDGCVTIWHEKSKAKTADKLILNRVYNQLCGLNIKEIDVSLSV